MKQGGFAVKMLAPRELRGEYDVVVVGSGAGGLVAALTAASDGLSVLVAEKADQIGGTSAVSAGTIWIPANPQMIAGGIDDDLETARTYLAEVVGRSEIIDAFVDHANEAIDFLHEHTSLELFASMGYPDYKQNVPGALPGGRAMQPGTYETARLGQWSEILRRDRSLLPYSMIEFKQWGSWNNFPWDTLREREQQGVVARGAALVGPIFEACLAAGVDIIVDAAAQSLSTVDGGAIGGVVVAGRTVVARHGVVLASGGFEWNPEMMAEYLEMPIPIRCSPPYNTGDGHRMGQQVHARLENMDQAWWAPMATIPGQTVDGEPTGRHLRAERQGPGVIIVDSAGERIVNESQDYNSLIRAALASARDKGIALRMFVIFDQRFFDKYGFLTYSAGDELPEGIATGRTLADVALMLGIDAATLDKTVVRFNKFAINGRDEDFSRGENVYDLYGGDKTNPYPNSALAPIEVGPFYGMEVLPGAFGTAGGLATDASGRSLAEDGSVIEKLYAVGNVSAHPLGSGYPGAGSTLGPAITLGYLTGRDIAERARVNSSS